MAGKYTPYSTTMRASIVDKKTVIIDQHNGHVNQRTTTQREVIAPLDKDSIRPRLTSLLDTSNNTPRTYLPRSIFSLPGTPAIRKPPTQTTPSAPLLGTLPQQSAHLHSPGNAIEPLVAPVATQAKPLTAPPVSNTPRKRKRKLRAWEDRNYKPNYPSRKKKKTVPDVDLCEGDAIIPPTCGTALPESLTTIESNVCSTSKDARPSLMTRCVGPPVSDVAHRVEDDEAGLSDGPLSPDIQALTTGAQKSLPGRYPDDLSKDDNDDGVTQSDALPQHLDSDAERASDIAAEAQLHHEMDTRRRYSKRLKGEEALSNFQVIRLKAGDRLYLTVE